MLLKELPKVSVIVPVYNVSKFLHRCLDSIINQTLQEIEIIIVNDCSPDPLDDEICKEYATRDGRIIYHKHKKNKGLGGARNTGIKTASGEYIGFVDSDDYIHPDMYKVMYEKAKKDNYDFVQCNLIYGNDAKNKGAIFPKIKKEYSISDNVVMVNDYFLRKTILTEIVTNKIIKKEIITDNRLLFHENIYYEDAPYTMELFCIVKKVLLIPNVFYHYIINPDSTTQQTITEKHVKDRHKTLCFIYDVLLKFSMIEKVKRRPLDKRFLGYYVAIIKSKNKNIEKLYLDILRQSNIHINVRKLIILAYVRFFIGSFLRKIRLFPLALYIYNKIHDKILIP